MKTKCKPGNISKGWQRYAAKLLFQFRAVVNGDSGKRRLCEERIITFQSPNARAALNEAKARGRKACHSYKNNDGNTVHFEFIGVQELIHLGVECEADEVWYEIVERTTPRERRLKFIPSEERLSAIRNDSASRKRLQDR